MREPFKKGGFYSDNKSVVMIISKVYRRTIIFPAICMITVWFGLFFDLLLTFQLFDINFNVYMPFILMIGSLILSTIVLYVLNGVLGRSISEELILQPEETRHGLFSRLLSFGFLNSKQPDIINDNFPNWHNEIRPTTYLREKIILK